MTNNDILKKLRVALMLRDTDIEAIMSLVDFKISTSELGAFLGLKTILNTWSVAIRF